MIYLICINSITVGATFSDRGTNLEILVSATAEREGSVFVPETTATIALSDLKSLHSLELVIYGHFCDLLNRSHLEGDFERVSFVMPNNAQAVLTAAHDMYISEASKNAILKRGDDKGDIATFVADHLLESEMLALLDDKDWKAPHELTDKYWHLIWQFSREEILAEAAKHGEELESISYGMSAILTHQSRNYFGK